MNEITSEQLYQILKDNFPKQNDTNNSSYDEVLNELVHFGINTKQKIIQTISKHKSKILEIDSEELDEFHIEYYSKEFGSEYIKDKIENKYWFAYQGLVRIMLELEFGESYVEYSNKRDNID